MSDDPSMTSDVPNAGGVSLVAPPLPFAAKVESILTWILEGQSEQLIREEIGQHWPDDDPTSLILAAGAVMVERAGKTSEEISEWTINATKTLIQKQIAVGEYAAAQRSVKELQATVERAKDAAGAESGMAAVLGGGVRDTRLIERAIRNKWPIPEEYKEALIARQVQIAMSARVSPGESTSAFKSLLAAESQNMASEVRRKRQRVKPAVPVQPPNQTVIIMEGGNLDDYKRQLLERANRLGDVSGRVAVAVGGD